MRRRRRCVLRCVGGRRERRERYTAAGLRAASVVERRTVFFQPAYGIPDENDAADWVPFREFFGLPGGDTQTLADVTPEVVDFML